MKQAMVIILQFSMCLVEKETIEKIDENSRYLNRVYPGKLNTLGTSLLPLPLESKSSPGFLRESKLLIPLIIGNPNPVPAGQKAPADLFRPRHQKQ